MPIERQRPLLCVDVDGVISLFAGEGGPSQAPGSFHWVDGIPHRISTTAGPLLRRLAEHYDLVWATGWEEKANEYLPHLLGLEGDLPYLSFDGRASFGTSHWKLDTIATHAADRPMAWIDDCIDEECHAWAGTRQAPTLLVQTDSRTGIEESHVETLIDWAKRLEGASPEQAPLDPV